MREHDPLGRDVELFRRHWYAADEPKPTSKGSVGAELVDGLVIKDGDYKLVKTRFSAFFNTHLHSYLQGAGINKLVITGNIMLENLLFFFVIRGYHAFNLVDTLFRCSNSKLYPADCL